MPPLYSKPDMLGSLFGGCSILLLPLLTGREPPLHELASNLYPSDTYRSGVRTVYLATTAVLLDLTTILYQLYLAYHRVH